MEANQPLLTKPEAAKRLAVCPRTIDNLVNRGHLPVIRIGSALRFKIEDVQSFIESKRKGEVK